VALLAVCLTPAGCANPCAGEGKRVEEALALARERQADLYAPEAMKEATASLERARQECRKQSSRFLLLRSYRPAQALFETALRQAEKAASRSGTLEGLARQEALNARYEAGMAVSEALTALGRAREMKNLPLAQEAIGKLDALRAALGTL